MAKSQTLPSVIIPFGQPKQEATGGALEGAERTSRATLLWNASMASPDAAINRAKPQADARGREMVQNDGYALGAENLHKDRIVGSQYRLNARPNWRVLGVSEGWAEEFQLYVENLWLVAAESEECWLDASGRKTFTGMVRHAVGGFLITGEVLESAEWIKDDPLRPFNTAIQSISPDRLSNPDGLSDDENWRAGIKRNFRGKPLAYAIRESHPGDPFSVGRFRWNIVKAATKWGRKQMIHIIEPRLPDQSRGVADMVSVLKQMKMTKKFQEITLENAVINASYAAAIESELPSNEIFAALGAGATDPMSAMAQYWNGYLGAVSSFLDGAKNIAIDGAKIPHLFPGTKLNMMPMGSPGGVGSTFEESLLRHIAAGLGMSYEELTRDYSKTNYSSARASMNNTWQFMQSRKKAVADRFASAVYALWLEEMINANELLLPPGKTTSWFYEPYVKAALCNCTWIGAGRGQIDELKETQAAIARIDSGVSSWEIEAARLGLDWRELFEQRARESKYQARLGLQFNTSKGGNKEVADDDEGRTDRPKSNAEDD